MWSHGFIQNVLLHWDEIRKIEYLNFMITVALWDAVVASVFYLVLLPLLSIIFLNPFFLLGYIIDIPAVLVPTLFAAIKKERKASFIEKSAVIFCIKDG